MASIRFVENVPYMRYLVRYTLATGQRRRMVRWSPGGRFVYEEVARELSERFGIEGIKPGSVTICAAD
jgi:hypothetical protein